MSDNEKTSVRLYNGNLLVNKPWGSYTDMYRSDEVVFKKITLRPKQRLSLQTHELRSECWFVSSGSGKLEVGNEVWFVSEGFVQVINKRQKHRIENTGDTDLEIYEMQMGECKEDDIIRYEDDYGRGV